jgi:serine/threonine-protein kinase
MDVQARDKGVLGFGPFRIDTARRHLTKDGERVRLTPRLFDTLLYLADNAGRVVDKDELMRAVWGERIVEDANLSQTVFALRRALREAGCAEEAIVTAPGKGYRFVLAVRRETAEAAIPLPLAVLTPGPQSSGPEAVDEAATALAAPARLRWGGKTLWAAGLLLVLGLAASWLGVTRRPPAPPPDAAFAPPRDAAFAPPRDAAFAPPRDAAFAPPPHSVAVLAFANTGPDKAQTYFSDGLSEELIDALARLGSVHVAARTSAFSFRDGHATVAEIGRKLNVGAVLEGSVRQEQGRLRIAADLVDTTTGFMLWNHSYDADRNATLKVQTEIAEAVTAALRVKLGAAESGRLSLGGTQNPAAYDAFLQGMGALADGGPADQKAAADHFAAAVAADPGYAQAHAALAHQLSWLANAGPNTDHAKAQALTQQALAEANRAIALAPELGDGYAALAFVLEDALAFGDAYAAARRAASLDPDNAGVLRFYGQIASRMGHVDEGWEAEQRSVALDPLSARAYFGMAVVSLIDRRYDDVLRNLDRVKAITGRIGPIALQLSAVVALKRQHWDEALRIAEAFGGWPRLEYRAIALHALGRQSEAEEAFAALHTEMGEEGNVQFAEVYAQWGQVDRALAALETAYRLRDSGLVDLRTSQFLDPVRGTADYAGLIERLHFPP